MTFIIGGEKKSRANGQPFNQHSAPVPAAHKGKWYKRHIILDHVRKTIYIQLMWDGSGELKLEEYFNILKGEWYKYVPDHRRDEYRKVIASGYQVKGIAVAGAEDGEDHVVIQIIDITNDRNMVNDDTLQALGDD
jgi:hypothetical protein